MYSEKQVYWLNLQMPGFFGGIVPAYIFRLLVEICAVLYIPYKLFTVM